MQPLKFEVTLDEANLIIKALSQRPFAEVYELVGKLNAQANEQLGSEKGAEGHSFLGK
ncbi:MAG: hypothetical protein AAGB22_05205 [Bacteroidota bacterium]